MIQRDANAFEESVGALEIRHFTSEMRVQVPAAADFSLSLSLSQQIFQRHAKLIFFRAATLKSSFAIQWGA
jgi:hypothetical protein